MSQAQRLSLSDAKFAEIRDFIAERTGISIGESRRYLIETRLASLVNSEGCESFDALYARMCAEPDSSLCEQVVDAMTTNETMWFRDESPWALLQDPILPQLCESIAAGKPRIRIWSAACATGQEPYSIAITILEHLQAQKDAKPEHFQIVASDISPSSLFVANSGRYDKLAIERGLDPELREKYFEERDQTWTANSDVRSLVQVHRRNLLDPYTDLGKFDLVFCRNVLIYFSTEVRQDVLARLSETLVDGGILMVGASESLQGAMDGFKLREFEGNFFYERCESSES